MALYIQINHRQRKDLGELNDQSQIHQPPLPRRPRKESARLRWRDGHEPAITKPHRRRFWRRAI